MIGNAGSYTVTPNDSRSDTTAGEGSLSLVPEAVMRIRVRPADFARMLGVSRQSVSRWVKRGVIMLGPDGRLDPETETRRLLRHVDPSKLRARLLRPLAEEVEGLRRELELLRGERDQALAKARRLESERNRLSAANSMQREHIDDLERQAAFRDLTDDHDDEEKLHDD